jgi:hypothetical protein
MPSARKRTATRRSSRRCVEHDRDCLWAGGDGTMERDTAWLVSSIKWANDHKRVDPTDSERMQRADQLLAEYSEGLECRAPTETDRKHGRGIFSPAHNFVDTELHDMIEQVQARRSPAKVAEDEAAQARDDALRARWEASLRTTAVL